MILNRVGFAAEWEPSSAGCQPGSAWATSRLRTSLVLIIQLAGLLAVHLCSGLRKQYLSNHKAFMTSPGCMRADDDPLLYEVGICRAVEERLSDVGTSSLSPLTIPCPAATDTLSWANQDRARG